MVLLFPIKMFPGGIFYFNLNNKTLPCFNLTGFISQTLSWKQILNCILNSAFLIACLRVPGLNKNHQRRYCWVSLSWAQNQCSKKEITFREMSCLALLLLGHTSLAAGVRMEKLFSWPVGYAGLTLPMAAQTLFSLNWLWNCCWSHWGLWTISCTGSTLRRVKCWLHCSKIWV